MSSFRTLDLNCDMGELADAGSDLALLDIVTSANIACGFHAGSPEIMRRTVDAALTRNVAIGAHPSFDDREGFGRRETAVPAQRVYELVLYQVGALDAITRAAGGKLRHVKPHGALYNQSARDPELAAAIARAVRDFDLNLLLFGLAGSHSLTQAERMGLHPVSEVFVDRTYQPDGSLTPRSKPNATIVDEDASVRQVLDMLDGHVRTTDGSLIPIAADTLCLHGDQPDAARFSRRIELELDARGVVLKAPMSASR